MSENQTTPVEQAAADELEEWMCEQQSCFVRFNADERKDIARRMLAAATAREQQLEAALRECAADLAAEIDARYPPDTRIKYPQEQRRYDREMEPVRNALSLLGEPA